MTLTSFRQGVANELAADLGITLVVDGRCEGPFTQELICSWSPGKAPYPTDVNLEQVEVRVRVFKAPPPRRHDAQLPFDPAPLEELAETIQTALKDKRTALGPWYFQLLELRIDDERWCVELQLVGLQDNLFE